MTQASQDAKQLGMTLGRMTYGDTRRIVNHENLPYYVAKDGRVIKQFASTGERAEWLAGQVDLRDLPKA